MKFIIEYEKKEENHNLYISIYFINFIKILNINLGKYLLRIIKKYTMEDDNNRFSTESYINYKKAAKIIWYRVAKSKKYIKLYFMDIKLVIGNENQGLTAILFGILNGLIPCLIALINERISINDYQFVIVPNFNLHKSHIMISCTFHINIFYLIFQYISIMRRLKRNDESQSTSN